jgi:uncharacterized membrane protein
MASTLLWRVLRMAAESSMKLFRVISSIVALIGAIFLAIQFKVAGNDAAALAYATICLYVFGSACGNLSDWLESKAA